MLVISREKEEAIIIAGTITLTVVDLRGDKARIRIDSTSPISVLKLESFEARQRENQALAEPKMSETIARKKNETIVIGENITIVIIEIRGLKVRLGIEAPREVSVHRKEVYEALYAPKKPEQ